MVVLVPFWEYNQTRMVGIKGLISRRAESPQLNLDQLTYQESRWIFHH